jgi:hypothetical protein
MNEVAWLASTNAIPMLEFLKQKASDRKWRLFAVACCRRIWTQIEDPRGQWAVEVAERFADGLANQSDRDAAIKAVSAARREDFERNLEDAGNCEGGEDLPAVYDPLAAALICVSRDREDQLATDIDREYRRVTSRPGRRFKGKVTWVPNTEHIPVEGMDTSDLIRELFGNPFRPVTFDSAWRTDTAMSLSRRMYESRDFSAMPILADALQGAGCENEDILDHCRGPGPHVRGCWVVDRVLSKG